MKPNNRATRTRERQLLWTGCSSASQGQRSLIRGQHDQPLFLLHYCAKDSPQTLSHTLVETVHSLLKQHLNLYQNKTLLQNEFYYKNTDVRYITVSDLRSTSLLSPSCGDILLLHPQLSIQEDTCSIAI